MTIKKPGILFLCVANSARSQMAEGLARQYLGEQFEIYSAGSSPTSINHHAVQVMKEIGVDISHQYAKSIDSIQHDQVDIAITLCAEEACPFFSGDVQRLHWPFRDPLGTGGNEEEVLEAFRHVRDGILQKIKTTNWRQRSRR